MGHMGQTNHPEVKQAIDHVCARARAAGMPFGTSIGYDENTITEWIHRGANFVFVDHEPGYVYRGTKNTLDGFHRLISENR